MGAYFPQLLSKSVNEGMTERGTWYGDDWLKLTWEVEAKDESAVNGRFMASRQFSAYYAIRYTISIVKQKKTGIIL